VVAKDVVLSVFGVWASTGFFRNAGWALQAEEFLPLAIYLLLRLFLSSRQVLVESFEHVGCQDPPPLIENGRLGLCKLGEEGGERRRRM